MSAINAYTEFDYGSKDSYFDGKLIEYIGWRLAGWLVTVCTLGICFPWSVVMIYRWKTEHTVIEGRRLRFEGSAVSLFGHWIKWFLLSIITLGIYGFWVGIKLEQWKTKNIRYQ